MLGFTLEISLPATSVDETNIKYGAIGDVVNVAARFEQGKKRRNTTILMCRGMYVSLPKSINCMATNHEMIDIKGRLHKPQVYSM